MEFSTHYLLMADHAMLQKLVMSRIKPLGLTTGQPKVLDFLQDHDGAMQKDIAKGCHIEPSSLSTILGGMERAGLLERSTRDENRRTVYVRLTDLGREQCRRLNAIFAAMDSVKRTRTTVPVHLQDAHYGGHEKLGHGMGYKYAHDYPNHWVEQQYLPDVLKNTKYYTFGENKNEQASRAYWARIKGEENV